MNAMKHSGIELNWIGEKSLLEIAQATENDEDPLTTTEIKDRTGLRGVDNIGGRLNNQFENMREMGLLESEQVDYDDHDGPGIPPNKHTLTEAGERVLFEEGVYQRLLSRYRDKDYSDASMDDEISILSSDVKQLETRLDAFETLVDGGKCYAEDLDDADVVDINGRIEALEGSIGGVQSRLQSLSEKVENPAEYYDEKPPGYDEIQQEIGELKGEMEELESDVEGLKQLETEMQYIMNRGENPNGVMNYSRLLRLVLRMEKVMAANNMGLENVESEGNGRQVTRVNGYFDGE